MLLLEAVLIVIKHAIPFAVKPKCFIESAFLHDQNEDPHFHWSTIYELHILFLMM